MMEPEILEAAARAGTTTAEPAAAVEAAAAMEMTAGAASAMTGVAAAAVLALASRRDLKNLRPTSSSPRPEPLCKSNETANSP